MGGQALMPHKLSKPSCKYGKVSSPKNTLLGGQATTSTQFWGGEAILSWHRNSHADQPTTSSHPSLPLIAWWLGSPLVLTSCSSGLQSSSGTVPPLTACWVGRRRR